MSLHENRQLLGSAIVAAVWAALAAACATIPEAEFTKHEFPSENAYLGAPPKDRKFKVLGVVRSKVNFATFDPAKEDKALCANYYNGAVGELLTEARKKGGDAVVQVRSVTFYLDGSMQTHKTAQCSDDGMEGQVLVRGVAVKWLTDSKD
ncbi:MAG: hypothetical protein IT285_10835 [Bdellovibrionales bacterium]|nr:hypothetical protein [Bdellovibrionales bacterium]